MNYFLRRGSGQFLKPGSREHGGPWRHSGSTSAAARFQKQALQRRAVTEEHPNRGLDNLEILTPWISFSFLFLGLLKSQQIPEPMRILENGRFRRQEGSDWVRSAQQWCSEAGMGWDMVLNIIGQDFKNHHWKVSVLGKNWKYNLKKNDFFGNCLFVCFFHLLPVWEEVQQSNSGYWQVVSGGSWSKLLFWAS